MLATELSGFGLRDDMRDTLVIAISQSGTTTDTNRTVDVARDRGAFVVAIVNRRNSDLVDKSDGVLFTSDGRDVEMSVASTKAFYAQIAAGALLAVAIADGLGVDRRRLVEPLAATACASSRTRCTRSIDRREEIAARRAAPRPEPPLLGRRRQRRERDRGERDPDQALGALLQGDRVRRHRGQEAHRPVLGAAHRRVRGGAGRLQRRRRREGGRDLPRPPCGPDRDRQRRRPGIPRRSRPSPSLRCTPSSTSCSRPSPATCSATRRHWRSTRRPGRCASPAPRSRRLHRVRPRACSTASARPSTARPGPSSTGCAPAATTAPSKPARPRGSPRCSATRPAACHSTPTRSSTGRSASRARWCRT